MSSGHRLGSLSAPPYPQPSLFLEIEGPPPEALLELLQRPQPLPQQLPQQVLVEESAPDDLDRTYKYVLEDGDPEIASNAIVLLDATTQYSRPSSRPESATASPAPPVIGLRISGVVEAIITAAAPVYAPRPPRASPPPPPVYADSAPRFVRHPPPALLVQRPRTRSSVGDGPLFEPLLSDNRCF